MTYHASIGTATYSEQPIRIEPGTTRDFPWLCVQGSATGPIGGLGVYELTTGSYLVGGTRGFIELGNTLGRCTPGLIRIEDTDD